MTEDETPQPAILDASGRPARRARDLACPQCGAGPDRRVASGGFGAPHPVCGVCGYAWTDQVFVGKDRE